MTFSISFCCSARQGAFAWALALAAAAPAAAMEAPVELEASLSSLLQHAPATLAASGTAQTRLSSRVDLQARAPAGSWGPVQVQAFGHLRLGRGEGLALRPGYSSTPNSLAFQVPEDPREATLAQAGLELATPPTEAGPAWSLSLGKLDPFAYFDANRLADDESRQFLNNALVHNPLLDSGGDIGADRYGFAPGAVLTWRAAGAAGEADEAEGAVQGRSASLGWFSRTALRRALLIVQLEQPLSLLPQRGRLRAYAWQQGRGEGFDGVQRRHRGLGFSLDQALTPHLAVFARWGHQTQGRVRFGRALVAGLEWQGGAWGRSADGLGLALARLRTSAGFAAASDPAARGSEQLAELYYRWQWLPQLELSPDVQWLRRLGGQTGPQGRVMGLRLRVTL
ncbi:carbohydrate porin [Inhella proteolytica]|uniref:Carbohydrate porin n=1 Tax=Inhella proteolytica TaxID=2795029 RepID=A0A931J2Q4_9BURK|nr:carbohydrate porin [Inhella proteolytica]MBH9578484.1 carbohydrate porin [Inhella proteolytica]